METVIPFNPGRQCNDGLPEGEAQILSDKHKEILKNRLQKHIKSITGKDIASIREETPKKLELIQGSKDFVIKLKQRVKLLHEILFDEGFSKSGETEKIIAAGLLYFISPKDLLPDDIPGLGYLDDAFVIKMVYDKVCNVIQTYLKTKPAY